MFWILRRTGAVNFFNSLNNNCGSSKGGNSNTNDKYVKRPPRKAYGRLSADSDDAVSMQHKIDDPFDDIDNFELIAPGDGASGRGSGNGNGCDVIAAKSATGTTTTMTTAAAAAAATPATNVCHMNGATDCQGNYVDAADVCDLALGGSGCRGSLEADGGFGVGSKPNSSRNQKEVNENTISRLQAMVMSDDDDYDESLTCNVCDRAFHCHRQLASHQQKKRHFGCSGCDSLFPSLMLLEHHKEEFEHWSDDEISRRVCCRRNRGDDYFTDTDSYTSDAESEDLERLL